MALDVAVDEVENETQSPEDRAHLHHLADPKLMRKRGELFEWSQRHKAPKQNQVCSTLYLFIEILTYVEPFTSSVG